MVMAHDAPVSMMIWNESLSKVRKSLHLSVPLYAQMCCNALVLMLWAIGGTLCNLCLNVQDRFAKSLPL